MTHPPKTGHPKTIHPESKRQPVEGTIPIGMAREDRPEVVLLLLQTLIIAVCIGGSKLDRISHSLILDEQHGRKWSGESPIARDHREYKDLQDITEGE